MEHGKKYVLVVLIMGAAAFTAGKFRRPATRGKPLDQENPQTLAAAVPDAVVVPDARPKSLPVTALADPERAPPAQPTSPVEPREVQLRATAKSPAAPNPPAKPAASDREKRPENPPRLATTKTSESPSAKRSAPKTQRPNNEPAAGSLKLGSRMNADQESSSEAALAGAAHTPQTTPDPDESSSEQGPFRPDIKQDLAAASTEPGSSPERYGNGPERPVRPLEAPQLSVSQGSALPAPQTSETGTEQAPPRLAGTYRSVLELLDQGTSPAPRPDEPAAETRAEPRPRLPEAAKPGGNTSPRRHRVVDGDTLPKLAQQYLADAQRFPEILAANRALLSDPQLLPIGIELLIPDRDRPPAVGEVWPPSPPRASAGPAPRSNPDGESRPGTPRPTVAAGTAATSPLTKPAAQDHSGQDKLDAGSELAPIPPEALPPSLRRGAQR